ncbi:MAG: MipA/OmpV family protein [Candidatus Omnitrophica bacterium]|nr:MipA/OmpV family protein [Candidatus Omnitrophota bacterium]
MKKVCLTITAFIILAALYCVRANGENNTPNMAGLGIAVVDLPYKGVSSSVMVVPIIYFEQGNFFIRGLKTGFFLYKDDTFRIDALIAGRIAGYDSGDSDDLRGMDDRLWSLDGGMEFKWNPPYFEKTSFSLSFLQDLLSRHEGRELEAKLAKLFEA